MSKRQRSKKKESASPMRHLSTLMDITSAMQDLAQADFYKAYSLTPYVRPTRSIEDLKNIHPLSSDLPTHINAAENYSQYEKCIVVYEMAYNLLVDLETLKPEHKKLVEMFLSIHEYDQRSLAEDLDGGLA